ncbi:MAG: lamin tail domain-containing protein, partial [Flavobacteriales bacterium]|nr:lamin tail domain-containing protein [Flavobacteriales bacterium]
YTLTIPYTGMQEGTSVVNNSGSGTIGGDDPSTVSNGSIIISGITEGTGYSVSFEEPCETLVVSGASPNCLPPPSLVINEVDYDMPGAGDDAEFVELKNTGASPVELGGLKLVLVNGATDSPYNTITLPAFTLAAGGYYVVGSALVPNVDLVAFTTDGIQNGSPDGIRLTTADDIVIDQMSYEGDMSTTEGSSAPTDPGNAASVGLGLSRMPDGADTDDNSMDFVLTCLTPGEANGGADSDEDGTPDCIDLCPGGPEPGSPCDDHDDMTGEDTVDEECNCVGIPLDCEGVPGGPALPGEPCVDGDPGTLNDTWQLDCTCRGEVPDCLGELGGPNLPGAPCDDYDPSTNDEVWDVFCGCAGTPCSQNVVLDLRSDTHSDQISWEILYQNDGTVVCSGGGYQSGITEPIVEPCCLPIGCFRLRVMDSGGDGFVTGGYQLRESGANGRRIIDNLGNFTTGSASAISNAYDNGAFCVPIGDTKLIFSSCDKLDWVANKFIVVAEESTVSAQYGVSNANSGYEFWFFDPNGGYNFRRFRSHSTSDGYGTGALRANHFKVNGWVNSGATPHLPANTLLNVRVRARVAGVNQPFGPACLFKIDGTLAACPRVKLQDDPANTADYSCGVTRSFGGGSTPGNRITANPPQPIPTVASSSVRYQFRFRIASEGICIVRPAQTSARLVLNWAASTGTQLQPSKTYDVDVRVSLDGGATWCFGPATAGQAAACADAEAWGKVCKVTISGAQAQGGSSSMVVDANSTFTMYPNPNNGDQLFVNLSSVEAGVSTVSVDIFDLTGKKVTARTIAVQDGFVKTSLDLNGEIANGMYLVNVTAGSKAYTERLVIQK